MMRMSEILNTAALLVLLLTASCNKEKTPVDAGEQMTAVTVTAKISATKAHVTQNGALEWRFDDAIDVLDSQGRFAKFLSDQVNGTEASFKGKMAAGERVSAGVYPSGIGRMEGSTLYLTYPSAYGWEDAVAFPPMAGTPAGEHALTFREAGGRLRYDISGIPATARSFHVTAKGQSLSGSFPVEDGRVTTTAVEESTDVAVNFSAPRSEMSFHIPVPCGKYESVSVWFEDASGKRLTWSDEGLRGKAVTVSQGSEVVLSGGSFDPALDIMTYNILYYKPSSEETVTGFKRWEFRRDNIVARIRAAAPAIFGTQENTGYEAQYILEQLPEYKLLGRNLYGTDYNSIAPTDNKQLDYEIEALYYNPQVVELVDNQWGTFWLSNTPDTERSKLDGVEYSRACTWAKFRRKGGTEVFYVFNSHFHANSGINGANIDPENIRRSEAEVVLKKIKEITGGNAPVVWTGDFNCKPSSKAIQYILDNDYVRLTDCKPASGYTGRVGTFTNFSTAASYDTEAYRYDFIFVSGQWDVTEYVVDDTCVTGGNWGSDHLPVKVKLLGAL